MTLEELLKLEHTRVAYDNRWLVWSDTANQWIVYEHFYHKKNTTVIYQGVLNEAIKALIKRE